MRALAVAVTCPRKVLEKGQSYIAQVVQLSRARIWLPMVYHSDEGWCEGGPRQTDLAMECAFHRGSLSGDFVQEKQGYHCSSVL